MVIISERAEIHAQSLEAWAEAWPPRTCLVPSRQEIGLVMTRERDGNASRRSRQNRSSPDALARVPQDVMADVTCISIPYAERFAALCFTGVRPRRASLSMKISRAVAEPSVLTALRVP